MDDSPPTFAKCATKSHLFFAKYILNMSNTPWNVQSTILKVLTTRETAELLTRAKTRDMSHEMTYPLSSSSVTLSLV